MYRSYKYKLQPTSKQRDALILLLRLQCEIYNAALEERKEAWQRGRSISKFEQYGQVKDLRGVRDDSLQFGVAVIRGTLDRLDNAFQGFFRRVKFGDKPGYPRFRSVHRFDTASWSSAASWKLNPETKRFYIQGIGHIKYRHHRDVRGTPKTLCIKRDGRHWYVVVQCADVPHEILPRTDAQAGFDLGISNLLASSDGALIENPRVGKKAAAKLASAQRALALKKDKRSNRRRQAAERLASAHRKVRNQRRDSLHKLSRKLINTHDLLAFEDLKIKNMSKSAHGTMEKPGVNVAAKSGLNRSIMDAGWGTLLGMIAYKAEDAGRDVYLVNPRNTSVTCAECLHVDKANRLSQAQFTCTSCGHIAHADVNAARNVLRLGLSQHLQKCEVAK